MKRFLCLLFLIYTFSGFAQHTQVIVPRLPLKQDVYRELPLGAIQPKGWLLEMLVRQKNGATGQLDDLYPQVMGNRNGWLGGDGDQWERGPYWIDGLLPLAYILQDKQLIAKAKPWIEWAINSQQPDGYFGPSKDYSYENGLQRDNSRDWWPKMVMLKVLKQYYSATGDQRVLTLLSNYFKYQLKELPKTPLDHWTFWAKYRGGDNLQVVYWLYNITGEAFLLELSEIIHQQTFDYTTKFLAGEMLRKTGSIHCVNLAQGMKAPLVYFQHHPDSVYWKATQKGFADLKLYNGMAHGLFGGDEALHGNNPTQGSELCSAVEMMFSLETILAITGEVAYADQLEKIAFNALPAQTGEDYLSRQYFQQANQVMVTRHHRNFADDGHHKGTDLVYGLLTGYPCCTSNMHQGWPKFTQNLWYATPDSGLAALVYAANEVKAIVAGNKKIVIKEETNYPFEETISFTLNFESKNDRATFPLQLRVPAWCKLASVRVNGELVMQSKGGALIRLKREWKSGDKVELSLPMHLYSNTWYENSISIERGPLVYVLKIDEQEKRVQNTTDPATYGTNYLEILPGSPWNYGLPVWKDADMEKRFQVSVNTSGTNFPWSRQAAPVKITTRAKRIPGWTLYNQMAGPIPYSVMVNGPASEEKEEVIELIPYGCSKLRIAQFPVIGK